jgi:hypothetical protein
MKGLFESIKKVVLQQFEESKTRLKRTKDGLLITLTEDSTNAKCREIKFEIENKDILIFKFDKIVKDKYNNKIETIFPFLNEVKPIRSMCDYIVFYLTKSKKGNEKLYCIICNLKSEDKSNMEQQIKSGKIISEFIINTAIRCYNNWNSQIEKSKKFPEDKEIVIIKQIEVYSKKPIYKGQTNVKLNNRNYEHNPIILECNNQYNLDLYLSK